MWVLYIGLCWGMNRWRSQLIALHDLLDERARFWRLYVIDFAWALQGTKTLLSSYFYEEKKYFWDKPKNKEITAFLNLAITRGR